MNFYSKSSLLSQTKTFEGLSFKCFLLKDNYYFNLFLGNLEV